MAKIFLDVGGHMGDSVHAALDPAFGFETVYTFEPVSSLYRQLKQISNRRLQVINAGLLDASATMKVYHAGTLAGSVYADAPKYLSEGTEEACKFIEASEFFKKNIKSGDTVYMKLNCEGAECAIMENLFASGEIEKLTEVLIDFDARKIPSQKHRVENVARMMREGKIPHHTPEQVQYGMINNYGSIRNWLIVTGALQQAPVGRARSFLYQARIIVTKDFNGYYKMRILKKFPLLKRLVDKIRRRNA